MDNPLTEIRRERGMERTTLAQALGVSYADVTQVERGYFPRLPRRIVQGLEEIGVDPNQAEQHYREWRRQQAIAVA